MRARQAQAGFPLRPMLSASPARRQSRLAILVVLGVVLIGADAFCPAAAQAAGPWRAQVLDAETGAPLRGVAVLAVWYRRASGHPAFSLAPTGYYISAEAVTDGEGRFALAPRLLFAPGLGVQVEGPELALFQAGYGGWRFQAGRERLTGNGAVIEMRPLRTPFERGQYLEGRWMDHQRNALQRAWQQAEHPENPADLPWEQARAYEAAINAERATLGLGPIGIGFPGLWSEYRPASSPGTKLSSPEGVAVDAKGYVYVADTRNHRVVKLGPAGDVVATWGSFGRADGEFQLPRAVAVDAAGHIYVADWGNGRIQKLGRDGRFLTKWGQLRADDYGGHFSPNTITLTRAGEVHVYVGDVSHRFDQEGWRLGWWRASTLLYSRSLVTVDGAGHVYAVDNRLRVLKTDAAGKILSAWGGRDTEGAKLVDPIALAVDATGHVYVADWGLNRPRIYEFDGRGALLRELGPLDAEGRPLRSPTGLALGPDGTLYVADMGQTQILRFAPASGR